MTIDLIEQSANDGAPQRLFQFSMGSTTFAYVNAPRRHQHLSIWFEPLMIDMDDVTQALSEDSPTIRVELDSTSDLASRFIPYMPSQPVHLRVFRRHVGDPADEYVVELIGQVANASIDAETDNCVLSVRMLASNMDRKVPWPAYQKPCNHVLYGPGCRVNRDDFKVETQVTGAIGNVIYAPEFSIEDDPTYFVNGFVIHVASGEMRRVIAQDGPNLVLQTSFLSLRGNDDVAAFAGCDLLKATCENKFNNLPRHMGFPHVPNKNPFQDSVFGNGSPSGAGGGTGSSRTDGGTPWRAV